MTASTHGGPRPETRDSVAVAIVALLLYAVLYRERLHHPDAEYYLQCVARGELVSHHFLYLPLAYGFRNLLAPLGLGVFASMVALSVFAGSVAAVMAHRALLALGTTRRQALLGTCLVATCPGVFYFATTVEIHVPMLAVANAAWWSAAAASRDAARPGLRDGLLGGACTGVLTALTAGVHATGQLLLWPLAVLFWLRGRRVGMAFSMGATHFVMVRVFGFLVTGGTAFLDSSGGLLRSALTIPVALSDALAILWNEWLLGFLPMSLVALGSTVVGSLRRDAIAVHVALLPYLVACVVVVKNLVEYGAYVLPMALPLAWVTVRALPARALGLCVAIGIAASLSLMVPFREPPWQRAYAEDALALHRESPLWVLAADPDEVQALARDASSIATSHVAVLAAAGGMGDDILPLLCAAWDQEVAKAQQKGTRMVLTQSALDYLRAPERGQIAKMMADVDRRYEWLAVGRGTFHAFEPRPK